MSYHLFGNGNNGEGAAPLNRGSAPSPLLEEIGGQTPYFRRRATLAMVALLFFLFVPAAFGFGKSAPAPSTPAAPQAALSERAPDFVLKDLKGVKFRLSDFKGKKPVLIIFSATWCTFCREEIPHFKSIHETYVKQGLEIVNIDIQESKEKVAKFTARYGLPYRVLLDEDGAVGGIYDIRGVPSMVLVDRAGNIVCRQCRNVEPLIEEALKKR